MLHCSPYNRHEIRITVLKVSLVLERLTGRHFVSSAEGCNHAQNGSEKQTLSYIQKRLLCLHRQVSLGLEMCQSAQAMR